VFCSSILGSAVGLSGIAFRRMQWQTRIPYGPYLVVGAVLWVFYGQSIMQWYLHLIGR